MNVYLEHHKYQVDKSYKEFEFEGMLIVVPLPVKDLSHPAKDSILHSFFDSFHIAGFKSRDIIW